MEKTRFERSMENISKIDGTGGRSCDPSQKDIAPDLGNYIVEFTFAI